MAFNFKTKLFSCTLDLTGFATPADEFTVDVTLASGSTLVITVPGLVDRTATELATAVHAVIDAKYAPGVSGDVVTFYSLGGDAPTSTTEEFASVDTGQESDHTAMIGISGVAGLLLGRNF